MRKFSFRLSFTIFFLLILGFFSVYGLKQTADWFMKQEKLSFAGFVQHSEDLFSEDWPLKMPLITLNGGLARLTGQRALNDRYLLDDGRLVGVIPAQDMNVLAEKVIDLQRRLADLGIPFLYVNAPYAVDKWDKQLPPSVQDYSNENADSLLFLLSSAGVPTFDLRDAEKEQGLCHGDLYFKTDHHWLPETALWAGGVLAEQLGRMDPSFGVSPVLLDAASFYKEVYEKVFLGSAGKRVGKWFAGMDDFSLITPKYATDLSFSVPKHSIKREGTFAETMLFPERFPNDAYDMYCGRSYDYLRVENRMMGQRDNDLRPAPKKVLMIRDSYANALIPFFSLAYEETIYVDLRYYQEDLMGAVAEINPDMVIVLYNPGAYEPHNAMMFDFVSSRDE